MNKDKKDGVHVLENERFREVVLAMETATPSLISHAARVVRKKFLSIH